VSQPGLLLLHLLLLHLLLLHLVLLCMCLHRLLVPLSVTHVPMVARLQPVWHKITVGDTHVVGLLAPC
jgi:hypothetical protein